MTKILLIANDKFPLEEYTIRKTTPGKWRIVHCTHTGRPGALPGEYPSEAEAIVRAYALRDIRIAELIDDGRAVVGEQNFTERVSLTTHLGSGAEGWRRKVALERLATRRGHTWSGEPSIGRWQTDLADREIEGPPKLLKKGDLVYVNDPGGPHHNQGARVTDTNLLPNDDGVFSLVYSVMYEGETGQYAGGMYPGGKLSKHPVED